MIAPRMIAGGLQTWLGSLAEGLIRHRVVLLSGALLLTAVAAFPASQLTLEQSIESLFSPGDPHLKNYRESKRLFGGDEFVMVAYVDPDLFSPEGLDRVRAFAEKLTGVPGVEPESTQHLAEALFPRDSSFAMRFLLGARQSQLRELVRGVLVGEDDATTAVILRFMPEAAAPVPRAETIAGIRALAADHQAATYVVGEPVQVHDMFRYIDHDGNVLFAVSLALLAIVLFVLFRNVRWVVLPLVVVVSTLIWTEALLVLSGVQLSMVSSMLNSLVTIIGVATVTHVTVHFLAQRRLYESPEAVQRTIVELGPAVFWTCATTAAGFAVLASSGIGPVRSFGMMMALGTLLVLLAVAALLPGGILIARPKRKSQPAPPGRFLVSWVDRVTDWVERRAFLVTILGGLLAVFAAAGFGLLEIETDFSKNFRESSPIVQAMNFVETHLGGSGTWEVNFPAPERLTSDFLERSRRLAQRLRAIQFDGTPQLTKVMGLTDALDLVPRIPFASDSVTERRNQVRQWRPELEAGFYNAEQHRMRLSLRSSERQPSQHKLRLIAEVEGMARQEFPGAKATGLFVLFTFLIESLLRDQLVSFGLAVLAIGGMMTIAFRSVRLGLISLVPNLLPISLIIGAMGWFGMPVNIGTAMIASISMGLTTDASIHYITAFRRSVHRGADVSAAVRVANRGAGRAIVFATLALVVGFCALTLSQFVPLVYFGVLVSVAMLGGLAGTLVVLPLLLRWSSVSIKWSPSEALIPAEWNADSEGRLVVTVRQLENQDATA